MRAVSFESFGQVCVGREITSGAGMCVVNARNPYGKHNLVLVDYASGVAFRHGNVTVLGAAHQWLPRKAYRKVRRFLAERGKFTLRETLSTADEAQP